MGGRERGKAPQRPAVFNQRHPQPILIEHGVLRGPVVALQRRILHADMLKKYPGAHTHSFMLVKLVDTNSRDLEQTFLPPRVRCNAQLSPHLRHSA